MSVVQNHSVKENFCFFLNILDDVADYAALGQAFMNVAYHNP